MLTCTYYEVVLLPHPLMTQCRVNLQQGGLISLEFAIFL